MHGWGKLASNKRKDAIPYVASPCNWNHRAYLVQHHLLLQEVKIEAGYPLKLEVKRANTHRSSVRLKRSRKFEKGNERSLNTKLAILDSKPETSTHHQSTVVIHLLNHRSTARRTRLHTLPLKATTTSALRLESCVDLRQRASALQLPHMCLGDHDLAFALRLQSTASCHALFVAYRDSTAVLRH
ncbi:unnamed protein product [Vicia faba]|uniref:Uncharacterized protein n=1 Tax=Vicia faba TaxID=3906 RepID=A0AAV0ZJL7_VICFA|nr:unnamed protein product [Vicia faba]